MMPFGQKCTQKEQPLQYCSKNLTSTVKPFTLLFQAWIASSVSANNIHATRRALVETLDSTRAPAARRVVFPISCPENRFAAGVLAGSLRDSSPATHRLSSVRSGPLGIRHPCTHARLAETSCFSLRFAALSFAVCCNGSSYVASSG